MVSQDLRINRLCWLYELTAPCKITLQEYRIRLAQLGNKLQDSDTHESPARMLDWALLVSPGKEAGSCSVCFSSGCSRRPSLLRPVLLTKAMLWAALFADTSWRGPLHLCPEFAAVPFWSRLISPRIDGMSVDGAELALLPHLLCNLDMNLSEFSCKNLKTFKNFRTGCLTPADQGVQRVMTFSTLKISSCASKGYVYCRIKKACRLSEAMPGAGSLFAAGVINSARASAWRMVGCATSDAALAVAFLFSSAVWSLLAVLVCSRSSEVCCELSRAVCASLTIFFCTAFEDTGYISSSMPFVVQSTLFEISSICKRNLEDLDELCGATCMFGKNRCQQGLLRCLRLP